MIHRPSSGEFITVYCVLTHNLTRLCSVDWRPGEKAVLLVILNATEKPDSESPVRSKPPMCEQLRDDDHGDHPFCG